VDVFLPRYRSVPVPAGVSRRQLRVPDPRARGGMTEVALVELEADGYRLRLVDHPPAFDRAAFYGDAAGDYPDNAWRFGLFCRAAIEALRADGQPPDVVSLHDWQAATAALYRDVAYRGDPIVRAWAMTLTIHNLAYHGWAERSALPGMLFKAELGHAVTAAADGLDLLRTGIERAEVVNTVSPGYAREALTREFGMGLDGVLRARGDRFVGIINGLDMTVWDPGMDGDLAATYSRADRSGKVGCRRDLLSGVGLDPADAGPVLAMIGRLDPQKGFDLLAGAAQPLLDRGARLVVLGSGHPDQVAQLRELAAVHPTRLALVERFDRVLARQIYAGADLFLMPSRFEPCGQGQMIALRFGTPPIVRRTGGLADTVVDADEHPTEGTGFVFDDATPEALLAACDRAIACFGAGGHAWDDLVERGMSLDWSWESGPARSYAAAFARAAQLRRGS